MKGRVKKYFEKKGYGFILGEDNQDYFFHVSQIQSIDTIQRGQNVEFSPTNGEKGGVAKDVVLGTTIKQFIKIGSSRVRINNIKNYGIAIGFVTCDKRLSYLEKKIADEIDSPLEKNVTSRTIAYTVIEPKRQLINHSLENSDKNKKILAPDEVVEMKYLYIETYQGDELRIWEDDEQVDIMKICKELDELLA